MTTLPACGHRGRFIAGGHKCFCRLLGPGRTVPVDQCRTCPHANPHVQTPVPTGEPRALPDLPCVHRSTEPLRIADCRTCSNHYGLRQIGVYGCALHGECTLVQSEIPRPGKDGETVHAPLKWCEFCRDRMDRPRPRFIATAQLVRDALGLLPQLPHDLAAVVGVARSGLLPATVLATALHLPLFALDQERGTIRELGHGWRLRTDSVESQRERASARPLHHADPPTSKRDGPLLIIDDTLGSGRSIKMTRKAVEQLGLAEPIVATVYRNPLADVRPDLWAVDLHLPHLLEWNFGNSIVGIVSAFDLDGIICHDEISGGKPGTPLYLPRRQPATIITGRGEPLRVATETWLRHWGVNVASLTMGAWDEVPEWETVAEYKADRLRQFAETAGDRPFGKPIFWESCPLQAAQIAERSGVLTVCPRTAEVFGPEGTW